MDVESQFYEERRENFVEIIRVCEERLLWKLKIFLRLFWKVFEQSSDNFENMLFANVSKDI